MNEKSDRRVYRPPQARDLSAYSAAGGDIGPAGQCSSGPYPYFTCVDGNGYDASCGGGATVDVSHCTDGAIHSFPACNQGSNAVTACQSGSHQNFTP